MNKILSATTALLLSVTALPALAEHHEGHHGQYNKGAKIDKMFEHTDINNDGMVTLEEHLNHQKEKFSEMDSNNDGNITKEEAKTYWQKKMEEWKAKKAGEEKTTE